MYGFITVFLKNSKSHLIGPCLYYYCGKYYWNGYLVAKKNL